MMTIEDIKRLNYIKYTSCRELVHNPHDLLYCVCRFFLSVFKSVLYWETGDLTMKEILFVVPTLNNQKSVKNIVDNLPEGKSTIWGADMSKWMPYLQVRLMSLIYLHLFIKLYMISSRDDKALMRFYYEDFITTCATYKVLEKTLLKNSQLKMVVMANDHVIITRSLIELTERLHVKSLYVQHASVTTAFPPLRFDYAFLDGLESYEKYKAVGNMRGHIFLSGSPRFDVFCYNRGGKRQYSVGIALNELDSEEKALKLCLYIKRHYSDKIIVRPHPGMLNPRNLLFHKEMFLENGFDISNPYKDLSNVFLSDIKVMVANESGIHLDAALMGVPSILYNFSNNEVMDWYSYIKKGLVKKCDTFEDIIKMLNSTYKTPENAIRYYAASFKTSVDGKIGEMIAKFVHKEVFESEEAAFEYIYALMINRKEYVEYKS